MLTLCGLSPCVLDVIVSPAEVAELIVCRLEQGKTRRWRYINLYVCMYVCK